MTAKAKRTLYIGGTIVVLLVAALFLTVWNRKWWLARAVRKWKLTRSVVDGVVWLQQPYMPREEFREDYLLQLPLRRLRELYDTGGLKEPAPQGDTLEQEAPTT